MRTTLADRLRAKQEGLFAYVARMYKGDVFYCFPSLDYLVSASDAVHMHWRVATDEATGAKLYRKALRLAQAGEPLLAHEAQRASALRYRSALRVRIFLVTGEWPKEL